MAVSAAAIKELRERTGAGMLDSKKALEANDANSEKSIDWLREKGIAKAAKKIRKSSSRRISIWWRTWKCWCYLRI